MIQHEVEIAGSHAGPQRLSFLVERTRQLRHLIVDTTVKAGGAHVGGALSMVEMLVLLYDAVMRIDPARPDWSERDRFVLSKGHGGVGHAAVLAQRGYFPAEWLADFNQLGSRFGIHLDARKVPGVDASTGSLGHGLPISVGLALGARHQHKAWRTYCILGDGECNEGSVWESAMAAAHFKLGNLTAFVDRNRLMTDGSTEEVMALEPFADKWRAFGWGVEEVDGHSLPALLAAVAKGQAAVDRPTVVIAHTHKGKGVDFMIDDVRWHYGAIDSRAAREAHLSIDRSYGLTPAEA
jgi:transketolase